MSTFRELFSDSLRKLGVLPQSSTPQAWQIDRAKENFNYLLDSWNAKSYLIYTPVREVFQLTPAKQAYFVGPSGDFNTSNRDIKLISALVNKSGVDPCCDGPNSQEFKMTQLSLGDFQMVVQKCTDSPWPMYYYLDNAWPLRKVKFWEVPEQPYWVVLYSNKQLTRVDDIDTVVDLPYGYEWMIVNNLALAQATDYGVVPPPGLVNDAVTSMSVVKRSNETQDYQYADPSFDQGGNVGRFNILTNSFSTGRGV